MYRSADITAYCLYIKLSFALLLIPVTEIAIRFQNRQMSLILASKPWQVWDYRKPIVGFLNLIMCVLKTIMDLLLIHD